MLYCQIDNYAPSEINYTVNVAGTVTHIWQSLQSINVHWDVLM